MRTARVVTALALLLVFAAVQAHAAQVAIDTVALTGVDDYRGPGMGPGVTYSTIVHNDGLLVPNISQTDLFFRAIIAGGPSDGEIALMQYDGSSSSPALLAGMHAPGLPPGVVITDLNSRPLANSNGELAQSVELSGTGITSVNDEAWLVGNPASPNVIRKGDVAPGTGGALFDGVDESRESYGAGGGLMFTAELLGPGVNSSNDRAVFYSPNGSSVELVSRENEPVAGFPGVTVRGTASGWVAGTSNVYMEARVQGTGITNSNDRTIMAWTPGGSPTVIYSDGLAVPGIPGATYVGEANTDDRAIGTSPDGSVLLSAMVTGGVFGAGTTETILIGDASGLANALPIGSTVPGTGAELVSGTRPSVGDSDTFAFVGSLSDGSSGILVMDQGTVRLALQFGSARPAGGTFEQSSSSDLFFVNAHGDLVIYEGQQVSLLDRLGNLTLLAADSVPFDVAAGPAVDLRTISGFGISTTSTVNQRRSADGSVLINEAGEFVFGLQFDDGSRGIFLARPVPEPASGVLLVCGMIGLFGLRRKGGISD